MSLIQINPTTLIGADSIASAVLNNNRVDILTDDGRQVAVPFDDAASALAFFRFLGNAATAGSTGSGDPSISQIWPSSGPAAGGTYVTIVGANLNWFTYGFTADIGGTAAAHIGLDTRTVVITAPAHAAGGPFDVHYNQSDGRIATIANAFTYV